MVNNKNSEIFEKKQPLVDTTKKYQKKKKLSYKTILLLMVGFGLITYFLYTVDFSFFDYITINGLLTIILAIILNIFILIVKSIRWKCNLSIMGEKISFKNSFSSVSIGFFVGVMTPLTIGDIARMININLNLKNGIYSVVYEKIIDIFSLLSLGGLALVIIYFNQFLLFYLLAYVIGITILFILYMFFPNIMGINENNNAIKLLFKNKKAFINTLLYSYLLWSFPAIQMFLIFKVFNIKTNFLMILAASFLPLIAAFTLLIPLGIGTSEFTSRYILENIFIIEKSISDGIILLVRIIETLPLVLLGFVLYNYVILKGHKNESEKRM
ncbi:MAG: lysylphosphatidylglycerol synthase transmembrane domain-containing protein [Candidatus Helarchaeota archaeon]